MKNLKSLPYMTILASFALLLVSCNNEIVEVTPTENKDFSVINGVSVKTEIFSEFQQIKSQDPIARNYALLGDTVVIFYEPILSKVAGTAPDLKNLKSTNDGKPVRMVSIGSNLTAGFRDGGYFNEGILTSYPNLIARQMQLPQFNQPLFDDNSFNGFGRKAPTGNNPTGGPVQKYHVVKNNLGIEMVTANDIKLKKYKGGEVDNFAIPFLSRGAYSDPFTKLTGYYKNNNSFGVSIKKEALFRVLDSNDNYMSKVLSKDFDFATIEFRSNEIIEFLLGGSINLGQITDESIVNEFKPYNTLNLGLTGELWFLRLLEDKKAKAVLLNIPDFIKTPYFNSVSKEMIKNANLGDKTYLIEDLRLLPTFTVDSLLSPKIDILLKRGLNSNNPLSRKDTYGNVNNSSTCICQSYNNEISSFSKRFGYPIVDIKGLYDKVMNNTFISDDGLKVDGKLFFSTDGLYPSALGQACIANEVIKVINSTYKTAIPLANIKEFVKK